MFIKNDMSTPLTPACVNAKVPGIPARSGQMFSALFLPIRLPTLIRLEVARPSRISFFLHWLHALKIAAVRKHEPETEAITYVRAKRVT